MVWSYELGGDGARTEEVIALEMASDGSVYATGVFESDVEFDDIMLRNAAVRAHDTWVARFGADGQLVWANGYGGTGFDQPLGLTTRDESVYVTGRFDDSIAFGAHDLAAVGNGYDVFLASFGTSDGTVQWARSFGSDGDDQPAGVVADEGRGLYLAGYASGPFLFNESLQPRAGDLIDAFVLRVEVQ